MELLTFKIAPEEAKFFKFVIRQINYNKSTLIKTTKYYSARMSQTKVVLITYFRKSLLKIAKIYIKKNDNISIGDCINCYHKWLSKGILKTDFKFKDNFYFEIEANVNNCYYDIIPHRVIKKLGIDPVFYPVHTQNKKEVSYYEKDFFKFATSICNHKSSINEDGSTIITIESSMRNLINAYHFTLRATHAIITKEPSRNYLRKLLHKWNRQGILIINNDSLVFKLSAYNCEYYL